jgi:uncharacterized membrane protein
MVASSPAVRAAVRSATLRGFVLSVGILALSTVLVLLVMPAHGGSVGVLGVHGRDGNVFFGIGGVAWWFTSIPVISLLLRLRACRNRDESVRSTQTV